MPGILLLSKSESVREALKGFLEGEEYKVECFADAASATMALPTIKPSVVLATYDGGPLEIDVMYQAAETAKVRFISISGLEHKEHAVSVFNKGGYDFLIEPLNIHELRTKLVRAQDRVAMAARRFTFDVLSTLQDAVFIVSKSMKIIFANPRACELTKRQAHELSNQSLAIFENAELQPLVETALKSETKSQSKNLRLGLPAKPTQVHVHVLFDGDGRSVGLSMIMRRDGVQRKGTKELLGTIKQALMESVLEAKSAPDSEAKRVLDFALRRLELGEKSLDLLQKPHVMDPIPVPVSELLELAALKTRERHGRDIALELKLPDNQPRVLCNRRLLQHIFELILEVSACLQASEVALTIRVLEYGGRLELQFFDTGPAYTDAAFEPSRDTIAERMGVTMFCAKELAQLHDIEFRASRGASRLTLTMESGL